MHGYLGPFHGAIAVPSVTRCRCRRRRRRGHRTPPRYSYSWRATVATGNVNGNVTAARSGEWAQHFSNASCLCGEFSIF